MKKFFCLLIIMSSICCNMIKAQSVTIGGITYSKYDGENYAVVSSAADTIVHAKVLESVTINGMVYPVTRINYSAFGNRWGGESSSNGILLESVEIPNSVTSIEADAFAYCKNLASLVLPNSVTQIGENAFYNCSSLSTLTLSSALKSIGSYAFVGTKLRSMELPLTVETIGYEAFPYSLTKLTCKSNTPPIVNSSDGTDYTLGNVAVVYVPAGAKSAYDAVYPWSSKVIVDGAGVSVSVNVTTPGTMGEEILNQTSYLSNVNHLTVSGSLNSADIDNIKNSMPNLLTIDMTGLDMTTLPEKMFYGRKALMNVLLPKGLKSISSQSFVRCINLESIILPDSVERIYGGYSYDDYGAFYGCTSLEYIKVSSSLKSIDNDAFYGCSRLDNVVLNEGLTYIGEDAFRNCTSLKSIIFPHSLTTIDAGAFQDCSSLKTIEFKEGLQTIGYYRGYYDYSYTVDPAFGYCTSLESVKLPQSLRTIGDGTFSYCSKLSNITIPEGVKQIGGGAFHSCI